MKLIFDAQLNGFVLECTYQEREVPKRNHFTWSPSKKRWYTTKVIDAINLKEYADEYTLSLLEAKQKELEDSYNDSFAQDDSFDVPVPDGIKLMPYQKAGVKFALQRDNTLIGDDMGLGKTCQAISYCNIVKPQKILVVCPASLKINWKKEFAKFCIEPYTINIVEGKNELNTDYNVNIINYDILHKYIHIFESFTFDLLIGDEIHNIKNPKSIKSKSFLTIKSKKKIGLTGTPLPNRPIDGFTIFKWLDPNTFSNKSKYAFKFCDAQETRFGWDFSGASNLDELQRLLRSTIMIRRLKKDVLKELPPKTRQIISFGGLSQRDVKEHAEIIRQLQQFKKSVNNDLTEMARIRKENAIKKIPYCIDFIKDVLENEKKVVVFAHHKEVVSRLCSELSSYGVVKIDGSSSIKDRDKSVVSFQQDDKIRVFVGSIHACKEGLTLTASRTVIFCELDFVPSTMNQAEDRCHRKGQSDNVTIYHLVFENSVDSYIANILVEKQDIIDRALNTDINPDVPVF